MKTFKIQITETLQRIVEVEAEDIDQAIADVEWQHEQGEIVLDGDDFTGVEFDIYKEGKVCE
jgi:hypothetical protein